MCARAPLWKPAAPFPAAGSLILRPVFAVRARRAFTNTCSRLQFDAGLQLGGPLQA
jgi:hypothetical protein